MEISLNSIFFGWFWVCSLNTVQVVLVIIVNCQFVIVTRYLNAILDNYDIPNKLGSDIWMKCFSIQGRRCCWGEGWRQTWPLLTCPLTWRSGKILNFSRPFDTEYRRPTWRSGEIHFMKLKHLTLRWDPLDAHLKYTSPKTKTCPPIRHTEEPT